MGEGGGKGEECPLTFFTGKFLKIEAKKTGEFEKKRWKIVKGKVGNYKSEGKKYEMNKMNRGHFFFFAFNFLKPLKFVWVYQNGKLLPGKSIFHAGKKIGKSDFAPLESIPLTPGGGVQIRGINFS